MFKMAIAFVAMCTILVVLYSWRASTSQRIVAPSDDKLITVFQDHRYELERLRQMAIEDMHQASFFSESNVSNRLPVPRRNEYMHLLRLSPGLQVGTNSDGSVRFIFASEGQAIGPGWAKGIQFTMDIAKLNGARMDSLDGARNFQQVYT